MVYLSVCVIFDFFHQYFVGLWVQVFCLLVLVVIQSLSHIQFFATSWTAVRQAFLSLMNSKSLPRFMPIESVMPSDHLILCHIFSFCLQSFPAWGSSPTSWLFASGSQSIGAPASGSVLPMSIQGWFPLGLTGLISLLSKGLSRVFFSTTIWKHQFFGAQPTSDTGLILTSAHDYWKNHSFNYTDLHCQSAVFTF